MTRRTAISEEKRIEIILKDKEHINRQWEDLITKRPLKDHVERIAILMHRLNVLDSQLLEIGYKFEG